MIFWRYGSEVIDHGDHVVIKTPQNPTWRWGNLILFPSPPSRGDETRWNKIHDEHFGPEAAHRLFVWDTPEGESGMINGFVRDGFGFTRQPLLSATTLQSPDPYNAMIEVRKLKDTDWTEVIRLNQDAFSEGNAGYDLFISHKFDLYRSMVNGGRGLWLGAWSGDKIVASCGIFHDGDVTRFQEVMTEAGSRNQGICSRLVYDAFQAAQSLGFPALALMAVDTGSQAERIYRRLGFGDCEFTCALRKSPTSS